MPRLGFPVSGAAIGVLAIQFHGPDLVSVAWQPAPGQAAAEDDLMAEIATLFYAWQLHALGRGPVAETLLGDVSRSLQLHLLALRTDGPPPRWLPDGMRLVAPEPSATWRCNAVVTEGRDGTRRLQVTGSTDGAATYRPLAVRAVLQSMLSRLDSDGQAYVLATLVALHRYFREHGGYERLQSITAGPRFALAEVQHAR